MIDVNDMFVGQFVRIKDDIENTYKGLSQFAGKLYEIDRITENNQIILKGFNNDLQWDPECFDYPCKAYDIVFYIGDDIELSDIKNVKLRVLAAFPRFVIIIDDISKEMYHLAYNTLSYDKENPITKVEDNYQYRVLLQAMVYNKETGEVYQTTAASRDIKDHAHLINHIDQLINDYTKI